MVDALAIAAEKKRKSGEAQIRSLKMNEYELASQVSPMGRGKCSNCESVSMGNDAAPFLKCRHCKLIRYCSVKCKRADQTRHRLSDGKSLSACTIVGNFYGYCDNLRNGAARMALAKEEAAKRDELEALQMAEAVRANARRRTEAETQARRTKKKADHEGAMEAAMAGWKRGNKLKAQHEARSGGRGPAWRHKMGPP